MANSTTTFSFPKRDYLVHAKLDEILRLWHRGSGQGSFSFNISDGNPNFQFGLQLDLEDGSGSELPQHQNQPYQSPSGPPRHRVRRRGPAKQAKNRQRAADYQAAKVAEQANPASPAYKFPGEGKPVGTASGPTLPLPLSKGAVFPPPATPVCSTLASTAPPPTSSVCTTLTSSSTTYTMAANSTSNTTTAATSSSNPVNEVMNEVVTDSDDDDEHLNSCARCLCGFDSRSGPAYYCPVCTKHYHLACGNENQWVSFNFG